MAIKFGPAGLGPVKEAVRNLEEFSKLGLKACEVAFTYGVYIKDLEDVKKIADAAEKFGIELSVHAPYWINLNSDDSEKGEKSKKRILDCCEVASYFNSGRKTRVVFHAGYYTKGVEGKSETFENIKKQVLEMMDFVREKNFEVELCPEVMGRRNVFGSIDEISKLSEETGCGFCIDFAHILARYGKNKFSEVVEAFKQRNWHCHFSGIEYGEKGEKKHLLTSEDSWRELLGFLNSLDKEITIICESPNPRGDAVLGLRVFEGR